MTAQLKREVEVPDRWFYRARKFALIAAALVLLTGAADALMHESRAAADQDVRQRVLIDGALP